MGLPEISYRGKWKLRQEFYYRFSSPRKNINYSKNDLYEDNFFFEKYNKKDFLEIFEKNFDKNEVIRIADEYCSHNIPIFEVNKNLGEKIIWNRDYKTGKLYPKKFIGSIYHEENKYGDIRYIWELIGLVFFRLLLKHIF